MKRRNFLQSIPLAFSFAAVGRNLLAENSSRPFFLQDDEDAILCKKKFDIALSLGLQHQPIGDVVVEVGKTFLGTEYVANALEVPGDEHLVVNMRGLDCVSFYENALVLARCLKKGKTTFEDYKAELQFIRYRGGVIDRYPSRLHYTSDYFYDNDKRGVWKLMSKEIGGVPFKKKLNFMSTHPDSYQQIRENPDFKKIIEQQEQEISKRDTYYIPKTKIAEISKSIQNGDILGMTTDIEGIDTSHTGIALRLNGEVHLMHAPLAGKKVLISDKTLADYVAANKRQTGIMVARPLEPASS
ncbi:MAG: N-acetylmuramoyl-L-alanine amidase-like domain-containing protein [Bacteroidota bacterium]